MKDKTKNKIRDLLLSLLIVVAVMCLTSLIALVLISIGDIAIKIVSLLVVVCSWLYLYKNISKM